MGEQITLAKATRERKERQKKSRARVAKRKAEREATKYLSKKERRETPSGAARLSKLGEKVKTQTKGKGILVRTEKGELLVRGTRETLPRGTIRRDRLETVTATQPTPTPRAEIRRSRFATQAEVRPTDQGTTIITQRPVLTGTPAQTFSGQGRIEAITDKEEVLKLRAAQARQQIGTKPAEGLIVPAAGGIMAAGVGIGKLFTTNPLETGGQLLTGAGRLITEPQVVGAEIATQFKDSPVFSTAKVGAELAVLKGVSSGLQKARAATTRAPPKIKSSVTQLEGEGIATSTEVGGKTIEGTLEAGRIETSLAVEQGQLSFKRLTQFKNPFKERFTVPVKGEFTTLSQGDAVASKTLQTGRSPSFIRGVTGKKGGAVELRTVTSGSIAESPRGLAVDLVGDMELAGLKGSMRQSSSTFGTVPFTKTTSPRGIEIEQKIPPKSFYSPEKTKFLRDPGQFSLSGDLTNYRGGGQSAKSVVTGFTETFTQQRAGLMTRFPTKAPVTQVEFSVRGTSVGKPAAVPESVGVGKPPVETKPPSMGGRGVSAEQFAQRADANTLLPRMDDLVQTLKTESALRSSMKTKQVTPRTPVTTAQMTGTRIKPTVEVPAGSMPTGGRLAIITGSVPKFDVIQDQSLSLGRPSQPGGQEQIGKTFYATETLQPTKTLIEPQPVVIPKPIQRTRTGTKTSTDELTRTVQIPARTTSGGFITPGTGFFTPKTPPGRTPFIMADYFMQKKKKKKRPFTSLVGGRPSYRFTPTLVGSEFSIGRRGGTIFTGVGVRQL